LFHRLHLPEDMSSMYLSVNLSMGVTFGTAKMDLGQCTNYVAYNNTNVRERSRLCRWNTDEILLLFIKVWELQFPVHCKGLNSGTSQWWWCCCGCCCCESTVLSRTLTWLLPTSLHAVYAFDNVMPSSTPAQQYRRPFSSTVYCFTSKTDWRSNISENDHPVCFDGCQQCNCCR